jgi:predicted ATPase/DNA-binding CsgD family transcriptional regulator
MRLSTEIPIEEQLGRHLRSRQSLLLLDNCEHLLAPVADLVALLLAHCPALQVLATSRAPLRIRGEHVLTVSPLPLPPSRNQGTTMQLAANPAVRLFVERAEALEAPPITGRDDLAVVAEICRQVDGLPLAIELAAARVRLLPLAALRDRLRLRLPVLEAGPRDAPNRQRTMRNTIAWSYGLLDPPEQALFRRLTVFAGGFTLEAAQFVAATDDHPDVLPLLEHLVEHHLVRSPSDADPRYAMLETIREFGLERLAESGAEQETRHRHAAFFLQLVEQLDVFWAPYLPNGQQSLDQLEAEYPNLQAALNWLRDAEDVAHLLQLAGTLSYFWQLRGHIREGREWLEWGLRHASDVPLRARAAAQLALAGILYQQAEFARTLELCDEAIGSFAADGDAMGVVLACRCAIPAANNSGQLDRAAPYVERALATLATVGNEPWLARLAGDVEFQRGVTALNAGQFALAERLLVETVAAQRTLAQESGVEHAYACWPLQILGMTYSAMGQYHQALPRYQAALEHARQYQEHPCVIAALGGVARILAVEGRWQEAAQLFGAAEAFCDHRGYPFRNVTWQYQRVFGLPEPWQRDDEPFGRFAAVRTAVVASGAAAIPPLPDPTGAAAHWAAGRGVPIEDAVGYALAVDLAGAPTDVPTVVAGAAAKRSLSAREQDVLVLLCQRLTDPQIAERLYLSPRTVESHVASILRKLDVTDRREAAAAAARLGLV